jgi:hypothetical protein
MGESTFLHGSTGPVFTLHHSVISCGTSERDPVPMIVRAHAGKRAAARDPAFEVIDVRRLKVWPGGLIVAAVPI